jgi:hypothetical protein
MALPVIGLTQISFVKNCAGVFKPSMGARNRVGIGLSYRPARLHSLAELCQIWSGNFSSIGAHTQLHYHPDISRPQLPSADTTHREYMRVHEIIIKNFREHTFQAEFYLFFGERNCYRLVIWKTIFLFAIKSTCHLFALDYVCLVNIFKFLFFIYITWDKGTYIPMPNIGGWIYTVVTSLKYSIKVSLWGLPPRNQWGPLTRWPSANTASQMGSTPLLSPLPPSSLYCNLCIKALYLRHKYN